jgi:hypothetical protein
MSAQARYTTLLKNVTSIYAATSDRRTDLLHTGLNEIVGGISPNNPADWVKVRADSEILLRIWSTKENDNAALEVLNQLLGFLDIQANSPSPLPTLHITDPPVDKIHHIKDVTYDDDDEDEDDDQPTKVIVVKEKEKVVDEGVEEEEVEEEEEEEVEAEEEAEAEEEEDEAEAEEEEEEEEVEVETEEADGMEVEQVTIRGRTYWIDTNSQKLYANAAGDEVGDEVGAMVNGKPVFLAAK